MSGGALSGILVSAGSGLLIGLAVLVGFGRRENAAKRISDYGMASRVAHADQPTRSLIERALGDKQARQIARSPFIVRLRLELEVADIKFGAEQLIAFTLVATIVVGWLLIASTNSPIAALLALFVPVLGNAVVKMLADRQRRAFSEQLPDNLAVISSAMRAGQNFVGALRTVVDDAPEPSHRELRRAVLDESLGTPFAEALQRVTERMDSEDFQHVSIVASLQRETGGNTAEVLDLVANTVRERIEIRRMVRGLTAQGRLSGGVLSLMPVGLLILISMVNPTYVHPLFHTTPGLIALGVGIGLIVLGSVVIRKIVDIKV